jgi:capsule polysaccharide export protein KpsC/LpsZ
MTIASPARRSNRRAIVTGSYWWNRPTLRALLASTEGPPLFIWDFEKALARAASLDADLIAWSSRLTPEYAQACADAAIPLYRIEDGFLRSIGLGAGFVTAASLAIDGRGIYYDANQPSDLEHMLETLELTDAEIEEGAIIRKRIVEARLTKYNLRDTSETLPLPSNREIVLLPGQVADDASILKTLSGTIDPGKDENINIQLLRQARSRAPDAFIIYKPHPDVTSGLRIGEVPRDVSDELSDLVTTNADIISLIEHCDRIETISSLAGFEALLRGKPVTTHGLPFYAGWGVSDDLNASPRRTRKRTIDELTAIAFTRYTRHMNPYTGRECSVHELIDALIRQRTDRRHHWRNAILKQAAWICERLKL